MTDTIDQQEILQLLHEVREKHSQEIAELEHQVVYYKTSLQHVSSWYIWNEEGKDINGSTPQEYARSILGTCP